MYTCIFLQLPLKKPDPVSVENIYSCSSLKVIPDDSDDDEELYCFVDTSEHEILYDPHISMEGRKPNLSSKKFYTLAI